MACGCAPSFCLLVCITTMSACGVQLGHNLPTTTSLCKRQELLFQSIECTSSVLVYTWSFTKYSRITEGFGYRSNEPVPASLQRRWECKQ